MLARHMLARLGRLSWLGWRQRGPIWLTGRARGKGRRTISDKPHALVIGGSVGGLLAASLLRQAGWEATVFERTVGDLTGRGAGLGLSAQLLEIMDRIGARFEPSAGVAHGSQVWMERDGSIAFALDRATVGSSWARVYRPLRDAVPPEIYRQGMTLGRVEQDAGSVTAIFEDGSRVTGDLLVAADGVFSTVRRQLMPETEPRYANYVAWRGIVEEQDVPRETVAAIGGRIVFCFPPGELLLTMAVPGPGEDMRPGHRRIYYIWYRPAGAEALDDLFTGADGANHGISIPPPLIRPALVAAMQADARERLPGVAAEIVERVPQPLLQAITDMESARMVDGRVAVMGDAAFVARPHSIGGVSKAALDAQCLADTLAALGDTRAALARFETEQLDFGRRLVAHSRYLGAFLEHGAGAPPADPERIIRDYGAPNLLLDVDPAGFQARVD